MVFVGIDYDTHCVHLVRLPADSQQGAYYPCPLDGQDAFERLRQVNPSMPGPGFWEDVLAVGIEEPGGKYAVPKLKAVQGAIVASIPEDLLVAPYHAKRWRTLIGMSGNASKEEVLAWVYYQLDENPHWPQDACDAYCLAAAVRTQARLKEATE